MYLSPHLFALKAGAPNVHLRHNVAPGAGQVPRPRNLPLVRDDLAPRLRIAIPQKARISAINPLITSWVITYTISTRGNVTSSYSRSTCGKNSLTCALYPSSISTSIFLICGVDKLAILVLSAIDGSRTAIRELESVSTRNRTGTLGPRHSCTQYLKPALKMTLLYVQAQSSIMALLSSVSLAYSSQSCEEFRSTLGWQVMQVHGWVEFRSPILNKCRTSGLFSFVAIAQLHVNMRLFINLLLLLVLLFCIS